MIAKVSFTCFRCGKKYSMTHKVNTKEAKVAWENWIRKNYNTPYCEECRTAVDYRFGSKYEDDDQ